MMHYRDVTERPETEPHETLELNESELLGTQWSMDSWEAHGSREEPELGAVVRYGVSHLSGFTANGHALRVSVPWMVTVPSVGAGSGDVRIAAHPTSVELEPRLTVMDKAGTILDSARYLRVLNRLMRSIQSVWYSGVAEYLESVEDLHQVEAEGHASAGRLH